MRIATTYGQQATGHGRTNTHAYVCLKAEFELNRNRAPSQKYKQLALLSQHYELQRRTLISDIAVAASDDPIREITLEPQGLTQVDYRIRRVGGMRNKWRDEGIHEYWDTIKKDLAPEFKYSSFNKHNAQQVAKIKHAAQHGWGTRRDNANWWVRSLRIHH